MLECVEYRLPLIFQALWNPIPLSFRKIVILPLNYPAFPLELGYVYVCYLQAMLLLHIRLYFLIGCFRFRIGYLQFGNIQIDVDRGVRPVLGQKNNGLDVP